MKALRGSSPSRVVRFVLEELEADNHEIGLQHVAIADLLVIHFRRHNERSAQVRAGNGKQGGTTMRVN
mgnify:CR=1 FL=1